jgi:hypothetical protein
MILSALGAAGGDESLMKKGVLAATYYYSMQYGRAKGRAMVDFGGTRPSLSDSLLRFKRKWGVAIDPKPLNAFDTLVWWPTLNQPLEAMLKTTPLVFRDRGGLSVLQLESEQLPLPEVTRGLKRMWLVSAGAPFGRFLERALPAQTLFTPACHPQPNTKSATETVGLIR